MDLIRGISSGMSNRQVIFLFLRRKETKETEKSKPAQPSPAHSPRYPLHPQDQVYLLLLCEMPADEPAKSASRVVYPARTHRRIDFSLSLFFCSKLVYYKLVLQST